MKTKQEWIAEMISAGAIDPEKSDGRVTHVYSGQFMEKNEAIEVSWVIKSKMPDDTFEKAESKYSKARNKFARLMRKDGWTIECKSYWNMFDQYIIKLEGYRPRALQMAEQSTLC